MAKDNGTAEQVSGVYTHPEFPERSLERLQADAAKFNLDDHLVQPAIMDIINGAKAVQKKK